jgi:penicillin-binding protein 2
MAIYQDNRLLLFRLKRLLACFALVLLMLAGKLWQMTILEAEQFSELARRNQVRLVPLIAPRGLVFDRDGRVLVDNTQAANLVLFRRRAANLEETFSFLEGLGLSSQYLHERLLASSSYPRHQGVVLRENLSVTEKAYLLSHQAEHPELVIAEAPRRVYRHGPLAAHALGYVGEISERQLGMPEFGGFKAGTIVGKSGVERTYNHLLTGKDGQRRIRVNSRGEAQELLQILPPVEGRPLELTLDLDLQLVAEEALGDDPGAVVAFNPQNGEILAMASRPSFDPNDFAVRISAGKWKELISDPDHPLQNRVTQSTFSPGSVFKVILALAGLEKGIINENTSVFCGGGINLYGHYFRCWKPGGHGHVNLPQAIQQSCNVYFYLLGQKLGIDSISDFSRRVGLGRSCGIDLFGEASGLVPSVDWKMRATGQRWYAGETISVAIGQGPMHVTPIQLGRAVGVISTGRAPGLRLVKDPTLAAFDSKPTAATALSFDPDHLDVVREGMWRVVNQWGTGRAAQVTGFEVCGKTGTAQTIGNARRATLTKEFAARFEPNAWFVGFAPRDNPEIVVAVIVQRGGSGGGVAAPIAGKVLQTYFEKNRMKPSGPVEPDMHQAAGPKASPELHSAADWPSTQRGAPAALRYQPSAVSHQNQFQE